MHQSDSNYQKSNQYISLDHKANESKTWRVFILTSVMMVVEIFTGIVSGSMALLADGWHMGTHAAAFGISIFAYRYARRNQNDKRFSFGPGKVTTLGGFASAVALAMVALFMIIESVERFFNPVFIHFNEAIIVAIIGLAVNIISAVILMGISFENHVHSHNHEDHNLRSAYFHVLADALTSLLAITALLTGKYFGWQAMDPVMGIIGALVIINWSRGLLGSSAEVLLDRAAGGDTEKEIQKVINEDGSATIKNLKVWYLAPNQIAAVLNIKPINTQTSGYYRNLLKEIKELVFVSIEQKL
ncbi:MAG: CDF family Co(II)/Ni(II) efflux transporter DmeF [Candidatus Marinimicrobia bacterium]|nr:CDF family Co(II)/Ni(II) efflux transporter DmeF [Candidatus Neomarinimicrobiota bacterium]